MVQWRTPGGLRGKKNTDILQLPAHEKSAAVPFSGDDPSGSSVGRAAAQFRLWISVWRLIPLCHKAEAQFCIISHKSQKLGGKHLQSTVFRANIHHISKEEITCKVQSCGSG